MERIESFLRAYETNLEHFDLDCFIDDLMDLPYQLEFLKANKGTMSNSQKERFRILNAKLKEFVERAEAKSELQLRVLQEIKRMVETEESLRHITT